MPMLVAELLAELKNECYRKLEDSSATEPAEQVLSVRDDREAKRKAQMKESKAKYAKTPTSDPCPVHPEAKTPHTWGECSHFLGKRVFPPKK
jgi:hypothetical protein